MIKKLTFTILFLVVACIGSAQQKKIAFEDAKRQIRTNFPNVIKAFADDIKDNTVSGNACIKDLINHEKKDNFLFWKSFVFEITKLRELKTKGKIDIIDAN